MDTPFNYTTFGPQGVGNAPTSEEARRFQANRFHSSSVIDAARMQDVETRNAAQEGMRLLMSQGKTSAQARDMVYNTAKGQLAQDAVWYGRQTNMIGHGNPVNQADNIFQGVAAGGFRADVYAEDNQGRSHMVGPGQRVSGNGELSKRVAIHMNKKLMDNIYGAGSRDPSKMSGFNAEEVSQVAERLMTHGGGSGNIMSHVNHAAFGTRLRSQIDQSVDPTVTEGLKKVNVGKYEELDKRVKQGGKGGERASLELKKQLDSDFKNDPKMKAEMTAIMAASDASVINPEAIKKISSVTKSVVKGMASIREIYGNLSSPDLLAQLETTYGRKIIDSQQAKEAQNMVENLRSVGKATGHDPAKLDAVAASNAALDKGRYAQALGINPEVNGAITQAVSRQLSTDNISTAARSMKQHTETVKALREQGVDTSGLKELNEIDIANERRDGQTAFATQYDGMMGMVGGYDGLSKGAKLQADKIKKEFEEAKTVRDRDIAEGHAKDVLVTDTDSEDFDHYKTSQTGQINAAAFFNGKNKSIRDELVEGARAKDTETHTARRRAAMAEKDGGLGLSEKDAQGLAESSIVGLGGEGMADLMHTNGIKDKEAQRAARLRVLNAGGIKGDAAEAALRGLYNADGSQKENFKDYTAVVAKATLGRDSTYSRTKRAEAEVQETMDTSQRKILQPGDKELSVKGIINAVLTDKTLKMDTPEAKAMYIEAMNKEGKNVKIGDVNLADESTTGIDLSQGFTKESLAKIGKIAGGNDALLKHLGVKDEAELIEKSKTDAKLVSAGMSFLKTQDGYEMSGGSKNLSMITKKGSEAYENWSPAAALGKIKEASSLTNLLDPTVRDSINQDLTDGKDVDIASRFKGADYNGVTDRHGNTTMDGLGRIMALAGSVNESSSGELAGMHDIDKGGKLLDQLNRSKIGMQKAMKDGAKTLQTTNSRGEKEEIGANAQNLKVIQNAIDKYKGGGASEGDGGDKSQQPMKFDNVTFIGAKFESNAPNN